MTVIVSESEPITFLLTTIAMLGTLVMAWRACRHSARGDYQREIAIKRRLGRWLGYLVQFPPFGSDALRTSQRRHPLNFWHHQDAWPTHSPYWRCLCPSNVTATAIGADGAAALVVGTAGVAVGDAGLPGLAAAPAAARGIGAVAAVAVGAARIVGCGWAGWP